MTTKTVYNDANWAKLTPEQRKDAYSQRSVYGSDKVAQLTEDAKILTAVTGVKHGAFSVIPMIRPYISGLRAPSNVQVLVERGEWHVPGCNDYANKTKLKNAVARAEAARKQ